MTSDLGISLRQIDYKGKSLGLRDRKSRTGNWLRWLQSQSLCQLVHTVAVRVLLTLKANRWYGAGAAGGPNGGLYDRAGGSARERGANGGQVPRAPHP